MKLQQIRNATLKITYAGKMILTDPLLSPKYGIESFAGNSRNPTVDLPFPASEVIKDVDVVLVSHMHKDHFDAAAEELLPKSVPMFCQPEDINRLEEKGFQSVSVLHESDDWKGIKLIRTPGQHGEGELAKEMGPVSGFILQADDEPTVYWAGDTIWYEGVEKILEDYRPDIIITHSCGAHIDHSKPIIMDAEQTIQVCQKMVSAKVIASHMDALDHATVTRSELRKKANEMGISPQQLLIPEDGEILNF